jgi:glycerol-3-phosphate O-acyltransferase
VVFVPVALNYDRVMEDRDLVAAQKKGPRAFRFSLRPIWRYLRRQVWLRLRGKYHRYGYAAVSFGDPLSLSDFLSRGHVDAPAALGAELMGRIARVMPVTPVPLVAHVLTQGARTEEELHLAARAVMAEAQARGVTLLVPREDEAYTVEAGLRTFTERRMLSIGEDGHLSLTEEGRALAAYYAASVAPLLDAPLEDVPLETARTGASAT